MLNNPIFFYISAFIIVVFTALSLCLKNIIYALLASIIVFLSGGLFFYILGSEYNAIIQAAVYGLAVPIIIGLSIMFSGDKLSKKNYLSEEKSESKWKKASYITILCGGFFALALVYVIMISMAVLPDTFNFVEIPQYNPYDILSSFAKGIFINYVWAFELLSVLLTIVIAGLTLFNKERIK